MKKNWGWILGLSLAGFLGYVLLRPKPGATESDFVPPPPPPGTPTTTQTPQSIPAGSIQHAAGVVQECTKGYPGSFQPAIRHFPQFFKPMEDHFNRGCPEYWEQGQRRMLKPNSGEWKAYPGGLMEWDGEVLD